jgi:hypothetical protein
VLCPTHLTSATFVRKSADAVDRVEGLTEIVGHGLATVMVGGLSWIWIMR